MIETAPRLYTGLLMYCGKSIVELSVVMTLPPITPASPSWFDPQQTGRVLKPMPQVVARPATMETKVYVVWTCCGSLNRAWVWDSWPIRPSTFEPQQNASPVRATAQE